MSILYEIAKPRLAGARCQCAVCGKYFNSVSTFDRHRVGNFKDSGRNRRCLAVAELWAKGWSTNSAGFWIERRRAASTAQIPAAYATEAGSQPGVGV